MAPGSDPSTPTTRPLTVTVGDIRPLGRLILEAGISLPEILEKLGLPLGLLDGPRTAPVALADYFRILEQLSLASHDETCRLSSRPLIPGTTNFVLSNLADCANLLEAMKMMAKSYNIIHGGPYNRVEARDDYLVYIIDDAEFPYTFDQDNSYIHFMMDCVVIFLHGMLSLITSHKLPSHLRKVYSKRARRDGHSKYLAFWDVPVRCKSAHYALFYDISAAAMPVAFCAGDLPSSKAIYHNAIAMIEDKQRLAGASRSIAALVTEALEQGIYDQQRVARRLGLSVATLRRRLAGEGETFRLLRHQVLNESAKSLLIQRRHIGDIAEELGFADFRSFTRAFKSWNGITPKSYAKARAK